MRTTQVGQAEVDAAAVEAGAIRDVNRDFSAAVKIFREAQDKIYAVSWQPKAESFILASKNLKDMGEKFVSVPFDQ